jgi:modulator of FtsH protease HflC
MKPIFSIITLAALGLGVFLMNAMLYTVDMTEQVIITQLSQIAGDPVKEPGLHFKLPFIQKVNRN